MGNAQGRRKELIRLVASDEAELHLDHLADFSFGIADGFEVQHYMPPQFPLLPVITKVRLQLCLRTWEMVQSAATDKMKQYGKPGIVLFYDEFFYRLLERDATFGLVFVNVKQRGEVLIKALTFMLSMRADDPSDVANMQNRCRFLGHKHRTYSKVRPHHFAAYTMTCIEVIMYWLGDDASPQVGEAWSNVVGFVLRYLLEPYLYCRTDPYELYQNTTIAAVREIQESSAQAASAQNMAPSSSARSLYSERSGASRLERRNSGKGSLMLAKT
ncbi:hypothetical protein H310_09032 [Aphanomyces invadans]|uniref:Globin domain-containing protein n=1 Tax=Aphanomyces invadans TaxID=157072 RepID=A0A024TXI3_9STRA|nr:hypothetical protein H310_09032 [Aphanomyces invadans]ETV98336.1 hypothetical protein H310_09032 [Aphanomyces invadans]|eukprot:XP_008873211.1 hypothetical protein H310_09032 [Aphanomyces invadans]